MNPLHRILAINPGSTSTKIAVYDGENYIFQETIRHDVEDLKKYIKVTDQYQYRKDLILDIIKKAGLSLESFSAVVGRGGILKPIAGGTYEVNEKMIYDLHHSEIEHASNLGGIIAFDLGKQYGIPAFIVDPVAVDEMDDVARISGFSEIVRKSQSHALNIKAVARKVAKKIGGSYFDYNFIIVHLGGGISVTAHRKGKMIDVNNANNEGPFSPERSAGLPIMSLIRLCFSGKYTEAELLKKVTREGGVYSYLGTKDIKEVESRAEKGDEKAALVLDAMIYQIAKEIGAMSTVLKGQVDRIVLTGGIAYSEKITEKIKERVEFIAPVEVVPGEEELEALAFGALRVLKEEERPKTYS